MTKTCEDQVEWAKSKPIYPDHHDFQTMAPNQEEEPTDQMHDHWRHLFFMPKLSEYFLLEDSDTNEAKRTLLTAEVRKHILMYNPWEGNCWRSTCPLMGPVLK